VFVYTNIDSAQQIGPLDSGVGKRAPSQTELKKRMFAFLADKKKRNAIVLTTYSMLNKNQNGLGKVYWRRIVLDEMQEIRSSTTVLAKACERLTSDMRWMVSGTPLYTGINDLNGELNFLQIIPFCLSDDKDGFWGRRIGKPFNRHSVEAVKLVHHLCDGILMRHSKSQTFLDSGLPILSLPPSSKQLVAVNFLGELDLNLSSDVQRGKEIFIVEDEITKEAKRGRLVALANALVLRHVENICSRMVTTTFESEAGQNSLGQKRLVLLNIMRKVCISTSLLNGGAGVDGKELAKLDNLNRELLGSNHESPELAAMEEEVAARVVSAKEAMRLLLQSRQIAQTRSDMESGMVRTDNNQQANYNRWSLFFLLPPTFFKYFHIPTLRHSNDLLFQCTHISLFQSSNL
jgi:SNF2 family DNA or RNA helicase